MTVPRGAGAIEAFDIIRFGGPTVARQTSVTVTAAGVRVLPNDPDRVMVILTNNGPDTVTWSINGVPVAGTAQLIGVSQTMVLQVQNDGALCGVEINAIVPINNTVLSVLTVKRQRAV